MYGEFFKLLGEAKLGNEESMVEVIDRFRPTIKKFSRELGYETAETDLVIELISILKKIKLDSLENRLQNNALNFLRSHLRFETDSKNCINYCLINLNLERRVIYSFGKRDNKISFISGNMGSFKCSAHILCNKNSR